METQSDQLNGDNVIRKPTSSFSGHGPRNNTGWDGKLRIEKGPVLANPEALTDPEYSDEDAPPVVQIDADEGS